MAELRIGAPCSNCGAISGMCRCGESDAKTVTTMMDLIKQIREFEDLKCEHVLDGMIYLTHPPKFRRKKCGKYYRC